ncbi:MAG TPA: hypothetical protein EYP56_18790 [Planctomycetaceae bacterium]|nr:hypothetical protein [Planctomycetaceae bacterium]HIQ22256.1 hypothetical protein [Planctomycetota bacterium]
MSAPIRPSDLEAYLDETLPAEQMARIEKALRRDGALRKQLAEVIGRRDAGVHSVGDIWRRHRLTCLSREKLGSYLLEALPDDEAEYVRFHLETVGCRLCAANLEDLRQEQTEARETADTRRRKYYQSSAGYLKDRQAPGAG